MYDYFEWIQSYVRLIYYDCFGGYMIMKQMRIAHKL